jgi:hypothetical protein
MAWKVLTLPVLPRPKQAPGRDGLAGLLSQWSRSVVVHQLTAADLAVGALAPGPGDLTRA